MDAQKCIHSQIMLPRFNRSIITVQSAFGKTHQPTVKPNLSTTRLYLYLHECARLEWQWGARTSATHAQNMSYAKCLTDSIRTAQVEFNFRKCYFIRKKAPFDMSLRTGGKEKMELIILTTKQFYIKKDILLKSLWKTNYTMLSIYYNSKRKGDFW